MTALCLTKHRKTNTRSLLYDSDFDKLMNSGFGREKHKNQKKKMDLNLRKIAMSVLNPTDVKMFIYKIAFEL